MEEHGRQAQLNWIPGRQGTRVLYQAWKSIISCFTYFYHPAYYLYKNGKLHLINIKSVLLNSCKPFQDHQI